MFNKNEKIIPFTKKVWLSSPTMHGEELSYIKEAYDSNWMSTLGENINVIEKEMARLTGNNYSVALASGTAGLHMATRLTGINPGDKVFCSDLTFAASANPILYEGGVPVFIDSELETWNMDPQALEHAFELYPEVRVVILAHLYGTPAKVDEIRSICKAHNALLIEDAAECLGAFYNGNPAGSFGDYNVISFNGNKIITGSAGGMLLTDREDGALKVRKWSTQSRENAAWYQHEEIGYNYRMSNVIAGVVRGQMPYLQEHVDRKRQVYERYQEGLAGLPCKMNPFDSEHSVPNFWLSCMLIDPNFMSLQIRNDNQSIDVPEEHKSSPTEILRELANINAEGRPIWKPLHQQPVYSQYDFVTAASNLKKDPELRTGFKAVSNFVFHHGLCLPSDIKMTEEEQDRIIQVIKACFE